MTAEYISSLIWGPVTIGLILVIGAFLTVRTRFIQLRFFKLLKGNGKHRLRAVSSVLAASMGTGNITGCAAALAAGGAGAVFWMWISAFLGMAAAYSENRLGAEYMQKYHQSGSPMLYIEKGIGSKGLAYVYAAACLLTAFAMGCMSQSGALISETAELTGINKLILGGIVAIITALVIYSSETASSAVMSVAERIVPVMGIFYAVGCVLLMVINKADIPAMLCEIVRCAFTPSAAIGGAAGISVKAAVSTGLRRGVFSNEAGMGSSVLVHSEADFGSPEAAGAWAAFEVFLDTIVCCTLTALAVMSSKAYSDGNAIVVSSVFGEVFGRFGSLFSCISISFFALASLFGWCCYGEKCLMYLTKNKRADDIYCLLYVCAAVMGGILPLELIFSFSDILNAAVMFPNLAAVVILSCKAEK